MKTYVPKLKLYTYFQKEKYKKPIGMVKSIHHSYYGKQIKL